MFNKDRLKGLQIIVSDLDGTLLDHNASLGGDTKRLIKELKDAGVLFSFASGRPHSALTSYACELDLQIPLISMDGCLIKSYPEGKEIHKAVLSPRHVKKALSFADNLLLNVALCHSDEIFYTERNSVIPQVMDKFGAKYTEIPSYDNYLDKTLEIVFAGDSKGNIKQVRERMKFPYATGLNVSYFKSMTHDGTYYLEIRKKGSNKGKGLLKMLKHLRIKPQNAAIIGDWYNDVSLFETPAVKVTLANGISELKRKADIIIDKSNEEEGVAEFFEMVLKAKRS